MGVKTIDASSSYPDCIEYLLYRCKEGGGLYHEVISWFVDEVEKDHFTDRETGERAPPMATRAFEALYEWDL